MENLLEFYIWINKQTEIAISVRNQSLLISMNSQGRITKIKKSLSFEVHHYEGRNFNT